MAFVTYTISILICALTLSQNILQTSAGVDRKTILKHPVVKESRDFLNHGLRKRSTGNNIKSLTDENTPNCNDMIQQVFSLESEGKYNETRPTLQFPDKFELIHVDCATQKYCWFSKNDLYSCKNNINLRYNHWKKIIVYNPLNKEEHLKETLSKVIDSCQCEYYGTVD